MVVIRHAEPSDVAALTDIYNHYVINTHITFDLAPVDHSNRLNWMQQFSDTGPHQLIVLETENGVQGYACSGGFRTKPAYDQSVESTIYLDHRAGGNGYGYQLYADLFQRLSETDVHRCYGVIALPNEASVALHKKFDFKVVGQLTEVGFKFDQYWDTLWMEKSF